MDFFHLPEQLKLMQEYNIRLYAKLLIPFLEKIWGVSGRGHAKMVILNLGNIPMD